MAIRVVLDHKTSYTYDRLVNLGPQVIRLRPAPHARTPVPGYSLTIKPCDHFLNWQQDPYGNYAARVVFPNRTRSLDINVSLTAEMAAFNPFDFFVEAAAEKYPFTYDEITTRELAPYLETEPPGPLLAGLLLESRREGMATGNFIVELNQRLAQRIRYVIRMEAGVQSCEQTLESHSGSCRDSAWLLVQLLRHLGLAARFVSGYLIQLVADQKALDGPSGASADFCDLHAWAEVYIPGAGWIGLDATSGLLAGEGHIPLACTADPQSAAPITGAVDECETEFSFHMSVTRIHEDPRVTKPYTEPQWQEIDALGRQVDSRLSEQDVRLTMGGEPTFVSIDHADAPEWNIDALGPTKWKPGESLVRRLREKFAPGGLLHFGQGKWYPGEPLPRWAMACYWRKDGVAVWEKPELIADGTIDYGYDEHQAHRFVSALANRLKVDPSLAIPGHEDVWHYLHAERRLPSNVDPYEADLKDPAERQRLAKILEAGLSRVVGYALPLRPWFDGREVHWESGHWFLRQERMYLMPGTSPMGFRLPLDSLPWVLPEEFPIIHERDPFDPRSPLPDFRAGRFQDFLRGTDVPQSEISMPREGVQQLPPVEGGSGGGAGGAERSGGAGGLGGERRPAYAGRRADERPDVGESAPWVVRTALCVEPREGRLHVFMPPVRYAEDYLDLVAQIEHTAETLELPVIIEGYPPLFDPRLNELKVTPDPGVLEVNVQPAGSWDELVSISTTLDDEARQSRLRTEKFMLDGRHTGTGGGAHIVLGGATPSDSPLIRRPHLLRSLIGYFHNHPSLSYLFAGMFIGPTSQAPRVDESRRDMLYELEIAFQQIPDEGPCPPWLVDRLLRNLLVDVTGNTHRAEFCIDKLFSPDQSSGRLGLLEMRGFEMPPHPRMGLAHQLLLRSLVSRFWSNPYKQKLVRWGTELHDRFMLPHFTAQDFGDVLDDLKESGLPVKREWFDPHFEFRFPPLGNVSHRDIQLELRQALEPWYVLGEEGAPGGTVRSVDSSVERLEVKVQGMTDTRHEVTCNGRRVPLHPTGTNGEFVAGVRYRAWKPPSCLHPNIPIHSPLTFDIVDSWNGRSIGGCVYHVSHPGGRSYQTMPVNALEADARRHARFFRFGQTPGPMLVLPEARSAEFPFTLDLRRR